MFSRTRISIRPIGRFFSSSLRDILKKQIPAKQAALKELKSKYGDRVIGEVTVDQAIGGGRDVKSLYYETSFLDSEEV